MKLKKDKIEWMRWKLGMPNLIVKDCDGKGGGLALFWKTTFNLRLVGFISKYHIDAEITEEDGFVWRFTGVYGEPKTEEREKTWKLLRTLKNQNNRPWLCIVDFNETLHAWEKEGGVPKPQWRMDRFREALEFCELDDLGFNGDTFTWRNNSHSAENYIKERLDRAVASEGWRQRFPAFKVTNGDPRHSDHRPVIVDTIGGVCKDGLQTEVSFQNLRRDGWMRRAVEVWWRMNGQKRLM
jgi:hypothetical protein